MELIREGKYSHPMFLKEIGKTGATTQQIRAAAVLFLFSIIGSNQNPRQHNSSHDNPDISDEQNFAAVSGRQTIESDAERLERLREARQEVAPVPVPERSSSGRPNVVAYALSTSHQVGEELYRRSGFTSTSRFQRNCARFASADLAQEEFLARGGPERDRSGLDPDGDGFACFWDPRPFRAARGG